VVTIIESILEDVIGRVERGEVEVPDFVGELARRVDIIQTAGAADPRAVRAA
jgi:hypothetical protein